MTFKLIEWTPELDLSSFYEQARIRGFLNNSSQKSMIDCFNNERERNTWILYQDSNPIGSVAAHSFDDVMPNSYRICARTCTFAEARPSDGLITIKKLILEHQNLTAQFFIPQCIEWVNSRGKIYITSNDSKVGKQRAVHTIYFPQLEKINTVTRVKDVLYRGTVQTVWELNVEEFKKQLEKYPRWN